MREIATPASPTGTAERHRTCAGSFHGRPDQAAHARAFVAAFLGGSPWTPDAVLLTGELSANAVLHTASGQPGGTFTIRAEMTATLMHAEVEDQDSAWDGHLDRTGSPHGLYLLRALSARCGTQRGTHGWIVWFTIGAGAAGQAPSHDHPGPCPHRRPPDARDGDRTRRVARLLFRRPHRDHQLARRTPLRPGHAHQSRRAHSRTTPARTAHHVTTPRPPTRLHPSDVLHTLADLLRVRGITHLYGSACALLGVLSVAYGLTVWCDGRRLLWTTSDYQATWPATDPEGTARILTALTSDAGSTQRPDRESPPGK